MANRYMGNEFPTKHEFEITTQGQVPVNAWNYVKNKLTKRFQDLIKQGHTKFKVTLEAID